MSRYQGLHQNISNLERVALLRDYPINEIYCAPGHRELRHPQALNLIAQQISKGCVHELFVEPVLIGCFTQEVSGLVQLVSLECLDGNHRLLAGLISGCWRTLRDLPEGAIETRVNGWPAHASAAENRWIPLAVAQRSRLSQDEFSEVPASWGAKGPTAQISGDISGIDEVFVVQDRGLTLGELSRKIPLT